MRGRASFWQGMRNILWAVVRPWLSVGMMLAVVLLAVVGQAAADYARGLTLVVLAEDGRVRQVRTRCSTVGELLEDLDVGIGPQDRLSPAREATLEPRMQIEVHRAMSGGSAMKSFAGVNILGDVPTAR